MTGGDINRVVTFSFCEPFIDSLAEYLDTEYIQPGKDLSRLALVFGGKRPEFFLKRALAQKLQTAFLPPKFFTIDAFIGYVLRKTELITAGMEMDQCYEIFRLAAQWVPDILKDRAAFAQFLPWAREILHFIEQLDLEMVENSALNNVRAHAQIGYDVPDSINRLLQSIITLRQAVHQDMVEKKQYSRGFQYLQAAHMIPATDFPEFDEIWFCNVFYLNRAEEALMRDLWVRGQARVIVQGDERKWPVLERITRSFQCPIREGETVPCPAFDLKLYGGFDLHSQVGLVREILKNIDELEETVIVLPEADHVIPLLSEIAAHVKNFNVSMGYPLKRSSLYSLFVQVFQAQLSRKEGRYYTKDYLKVLRHPLVKNLRLSGPPVVTRVLVHKLEEILTGQYETPVSGMLFVSLEEVEAAGDLYALAGETLAGMGIVVTSAELRSVMIALHEKLFALWENLENFSGFSSSLEAFLDLLLRASALSLYPLNLKIAGKMYDVADEFRRAVFSGEKFPVEDLFKIFAEKIEREIVAFSGSPLRGLQILGLFETRALNFKHVIVMDVNEGILPRVNLYEPLIPREVMISLNLDRLEQEEEIQRYQFMRLISSAKTVHLVYQESRDKERSRFVEELIWEAEKKAGKRGALPVFTPGFRVEAPAGQASVAKTPEMIGLLRGMSYSASSINAYLRNPMDFYLNYVLGLREKEDLLDEPENRQVGTFVHALLEAAFKKFVGQQPVLNASFQRHFKESFCEFFEKTFASSMKSDAFLLKTVLETRLDLFLRNECENPERKVKEILFIEKRFADRIPLPSGSFAFVCRVDRVDRLDDGTVMILDYKTGVADPLPRGLEVIERMALSRQTIYENVRSFQLPLYFYYLQKYFPGDRLNAAFYNLRTLELSPLIRHPMADDYERINRGFLRALDYVMAEILNADVPFVNDPMD
ncbi:MAG TPA: PD-(D/E)XK nuclease family protein [Candidatus Omnitrophota bacterium]|nr:PD-(D/E)XK nuclease family protein [Candidatus Omnitrophota bacterium]